MYGIKIEAPNGTAQIFLVEFDVVLIGSHDENNIILRDAAIHYEHLQVDIEPSADEPQYAVVTDLSSETGTLLGITPLSPEQPIIWPLDQVIYIGPFKLSLVQVAEEGSAQTPSSTVEGATDAEVLGAALYTNTTNITIPAGNSQGSEYLDVSYVIVNQADDTDLFSLLISGISTEWYAKLPQIMLAPGSQADVVVRYLIPRLSEDELGTYPIEIVAYSEHSDYRSRPLQSSLTVIDALVSEDAESYQLDDLPGFLQDRNLPDSLQNKPPAVDQTTLPEPSATDVVTDSDLDESPIGNGEDVDAFDRESRLETEIWTEDEEVFPASTSESTTDEPASTDDVPSPDEPWGTTTDLLGTITEPMSFGDTHDDSLPGDLEETLTDEKPWDEQLFDDDPWDELEPYAPPAKDTESLEATTLDEDPSFSHALETIGSTFVPSAMESNPDEGGEGTAVSDGMSPDDPTEIAVRRFKQDGSSDLYGVNKDVVLIGSGEGDDIQIEEVGVIPHHLALHIDENDNVTVVPKSNAAGVFIGRAKAPEDEHTNWPTEMMLHIGRDVRLGLEQTTTARSLVELYPTSDVQEWNVSGGQRPFATYIVANMGKRADRFRLNVMGMPDQWAVTTPPIELAAGSKGELSIQFDVPDSIEVTAGDRPFQVSAVGMAYGSESNPLAGLIRVGAFNDFQTYLDPVSADIGQSVRVTVTNRGNSLETFNLAWHDTQDELDFSPSGESMALSPGESQSATFNTEYRERQPWFGRKKYPFKAIISDTAGEIQTKEGQITGKGCFPMWLLLIPLFCFLCAAIPALVSSRLDLNSALSGLGLPDIQLPAFITDLGIGDQGTLGDSDDVIGSDTTLSVEATRNAVAFATASAEIAQQQELAAIATSTWLELDDDADGLTNRNEQDIGTIVDKRDTDEDGIDDGEEIHKWLTSPLTKDTDSDGFGDLEEIRRGTDPRNPDTDGDGILDPQDPNPGQKPTPTPDATKTAIAQSVATAQAGCYIDTGFDTLNLRSGPGELYEPPVANLPNGLWLQPLSYRNPGIPAGEWIEVLVRGTEWRGWVSRQWIKCNMEVTTLPAGEIPPTPTVTVVATATAIPTTTPVITTGPEPATATATATEVPPIIEPVPTEPSTQVPTVPAPTIPAPDATPTAGSGDGGGTIPEPTQPPDADLDSIETVYGALKLANVQTDKLLYLAGEPIVLSYDLVNGSGQQINVPQPQQGAQPLVGTRQHWIERLDSDPTIPGLSEEDKTDNRYRFKNEVIAASILFPDVPLPNQQSLNTTNFPSGGYLITVEYRSLEGTVLDVQSAALEIE